MSEPAQAPVAPGDPDRTSAAAGRPPADTSPGLRRAVRVFVWACVLWCCHYPLRMDRLYRAIPFDAVAGSYHRGAAREWQKLARHDALTRMLADLGVEDAAEWRDDEGIFQTLFWLTGKHTVFGLRCVPGDTLSDVRVYGASHVGWKARPMEFLKLIRWIPGLGRLQRTEAGSLYLTFPRSKTMRRLGLVLSLDLFEGVLVGVLSANPDAVQELSERVRHDFDANDLFGPDLEPWQEPCPANHRVWVSERATRWFDERLGPWRFDVVSLEQERLGLVARGEPWGAVAWDDSWSFGGEAPSGGPVPADAPFAALCLSRTAADRLWPSDVPRVPAAPVSGHPWAYAASEPYEGRLLGLALPFVGLRMPWPNEADPAPWVRRLLDEAGRSGRTAPLVARSSALPDGRRRLLLDAATIGVLGRLADEDCVFVEAEGGALVAGSHLGSHLRSVEATQDGTAFARLGETLRAVPDAAGWLWVDLPRANRALRGLVAVYRLAARLSGSASAETDAVLDHLLAGMQAATSFRSIEVTAFPRAAALELRVDLSADRGRESPVDGEAAETR